jgi:hypothetical protein
MAILFPLSLRGFGTYDIESISSFVHQLSASHGVTVNRLLESSFGWYMQKYDDVSYHELRACGNICFLSRPKISTEDLIKVLTFVTGQKNLRSGTFLAVHKALDRAVNQYASHTRWCPSCMYEFEIADDPGYFKLIWSLKELSHCPEHRVALVDKCPECGSFQDGFGLKTLCTVCQNCNASLGRHARPEEIAHSWELRGLDLLDFVETIAKDPTLSYPENGVKNLLSTIFDKAWNRNEEKLLWSKISRDEYLGLTCGNATVSLQIARRFATRLGVSLHDLLTGKIDSLPGILDPEWFKDIPKEFKPTKRRAKHDRDEIFQKLLAYSSDKHLDNPLPFSQVAKEIGMSKGYLEYHFPETCATIAKNHQSWYEQNQLKKQHIALSEALKYFNNAPDPYSNWSKKDALRKIRAKTGLPKNMLREEINRVYEIIYKLY